MSAAATVNRIPGGTAGTVATLDAMHRAVLQGQHDPGVVVYAQSIVANLPEHDRDAEIGAIFKQVREDFRYTRDPLGVEFVKTPTRIMREIEDRGWAALDCDDASVWLAALLRAVGIDTRFRAIRASSARPRDFSHVYVEAEGNGGRWIALDPIARSYGMGSAPPALFGSMAYGGMGAHRAGRSARAPRRTTVYQLDGVGDGAPNPWANAMAIASHEYGYGGKSTVAQTPSLGGMGITARRLQKLAPAVLDALGIKPDSPEAVALAQEAGVLPLADPQPAPYQEPAPRGGATKWIIGGAVAVAAGWLAWRAFRKRGRR